MSPKHIKEITNENRRAVAPYNFVELPDKVVTAEELPNGDRYHCDRHTGKIECTLTTESPLYTRCGWSPEDFAKHGETAFNDLPDDIKNLRANFFINPATAQLMIPGSSIRGMLRTLVEIVSFSKIERVSGHQRLFFRAVGSNPKKESWGKEYKTYVAPEIVKAGYLTKDGNKWSIQPASCQNQKTFAWVKENYLDLEKLNLKEFNHKQYQPQYINISYDNVAIDTADRAKRLFVNNVDLPDTHPTKAVLVTSGNMKQTDNDQSPRLNHCIVFLQNKQAEALEIDHTAIEHYRNTLTDFQKTSPFDKDWGILKEGRPVFYYHDENSTTVGFFGQSPNFRIPYSPEGNGHATTVLDFIPNNLRKLASIDIADAIFGWVKQESEQEKLPESFDKQRAGRIFVTDALYQSHENGIWYSENSVTPQILSEPKPSYFPHYLVQTDADKLELKHYASEPLEETVIRGHKLYWHKGSDPDFQLTVTAPKKIINSSKKVVSSPENKADTQTTLIKPIQKGVTFKFDIHFENLSDVELGAFLWVLDIAQNDQYRLSLGMGKPLGLGAVKIEPTLCFSDRKKRYQKLFDNQGSWEKAETEQQDISGYVSSFEEDMLNKLNYTGNFKDLCRIKMLLTMLSWPGITDVENNARYMEIERDCKKSHIGHCKSNDKTINEYKERPVLPSPLDVMGKIQGDEIKCDRPSVSSSPEQTTAQATQPFSEGQEVEAKVVDISIKEGQKRKTIITYEIEGSDCPSKEEVNKRTVFLEIGAIVKVKIHKVKGNNIRKVKHI